MPQKRIIFIVIFIISIIIGGIIYCLVFKKPTEKEEIPSEGKTLEEVLKSLTAPEQEKIEVPEKVLKELSAPKNEIKVPEEVLKSLTPPK